MLLLAFVASVGFAHLYVVERVVLGPSWPSPVEVSLLGLCAAGFGSIVLVMLPLPRRGTLSRIHLWFENLWLGFVLLLTLSMLACDALYAVAALLLPADGLPSGWSPVDGARSRAIAASSLALLAAARGLYGGLREPATMRVEIALARWPENLDGFRVLQISDLHIGPIRRRHFAARVAQRVNSLDPDLVVVTGDLVDGRVEDIAMEVEPLRSLESRHGVFFITGNHEGYSGVDPWVDRCRKLGWRSLRNERVAISGGESGFDLAGIDDESISGASDGDRSSDLDRALEGRDLTRPVILLAHRPRVFARAMKQGVDLQLSGHTHGGQIWPGSWVVRLRDRWVTGHFSVGESHLYVNQGTGSFGPPYRLGSRTEITELILRRAAGGRASGESGACSSYARRTRDDSVLSESRS